jgi:hypothetical protein
MITENARERSDSVREARTTVLREIGHHFGMDEEELDRLAYGRHVAREVESRRTRFYQTKPPSG